MGLSVCVSVSLSVKSHLTYGAPVGHENAVTYSAGNEGQKICGVFSEYAPLLRLSLLLTPQLGVYKFCDFKRRGRNAVSFIKYLCCK